MKSRRLQKASVLNMTWQPRKKHLEEGKTHLAQVGPEGVSHLAQFGWPMSGP
jgi:hypothetical protein